AVAATSGSVNAIGRLAVIPLLFFAGLWLPRALMPTVLQDMSNYTPLGAAVEAIQDSMQTGFPPARPLLVLVAYAVVFAAAAPRRRSRHPQGVTARGARPLILPRLPGKPHAVILAARHVRVNSPPVPGPISGRPGRPGRAARRGCRPCPAGCG